MTACFLYCFLCHDYRQCQMTVIEVKENEAIRTKMLSCDNPFFDEERQHRSVKTVEGMNQRIFDIIADRSNNVST